MNQAAETLGILPPRTGEIHVYADGACSGNPGAGGWSSVLVNAAGEATTASGGEAMTTNNQMELRAAIDAVTRGASQVPPRLVIHADSKYVIDGITGWIKSWRRNGWKTAGGGEVKNKELWQALDAAMNNAKAAGVIVVFEWVRGHAGNPGNEAADAAARDAIRKVRGGTRAALVGAALALLLGAGLPARAEPPLNALPGQSAANPVQAGGWIVSGGDPGNWGFAMGPVGDPNMHLKLLRANPDKSGAIGFMCGRKDGVMQLALTLPGVAFTLGEERDMNLTVGDRTQPLRVVVRAEPLPGVPPTFEATGPAIPDILKAMGEVPTTRLDSQLRFDDGQNHAVSFGLTQPRGVAGAAAEICAAWSTAVHPPSGTAAPTPQSPPPAPAAAVPSGELVLPPVAADGAAGAGVTSPPDNMTPTGRVNQRGR